MAKATTKKKDIRVFLGKGERGKSYLMRHQMKPEKRLLIFDPNAEEEYAEGAVVCETKADLVAALKDKGAFKICWRGFVTMGKAAYEFGNRAALAAGNCLVMWEEVDRFIGPSDLRQSPYADKIINAGRHWGVRVFAAARRAARVPRDLTANATRIIIFQSDENADIRYVRDRCGEEWAAQLPSLPQYHAIEYTDAETRLKKSPFS